MKCVCTQKQKMAFTGHVLRGSGGEDALQILEGKLEVIAPQGRPLAPRHVNLLIQKMRADD